MSVALDQIARVVDGAAMFRGVSLTLERGALSVLLGQALSGLGHAFARCSRQADQRPRAGRRQGRHWP
jgi:hypothetical protein